MSVNQYMRSVVSAILGKSEHPRITHPAQIEAALAAMASGGSWRGGVLTTDQVARVAAAYTCGKVLSDAMMSFPLHMFRREGRNKDIADDHWMAALMKRPCRGMTLATWIWYLQWCLTFRGNAYCRRVMSRGRVVELFPINPDRVVPFRDEFGDRKFKVTGKNGITEIFGPEDIWHLMGASTDGDRGLGVIEYQMETFNNALRATEHASTSLKNGASIGTAISVAGRLKPETRQAMKDDFKEKNAGGANAGNLMILEEGAKLERATMTMAEFQFIESRNYTRGEIAALFGVPPHRVGDNSKSTFTVEQLGIEFITNTMVPIARVWEMSLEMLMDDSRDKVEPKFNMAGMQRGDINTRYRAYASGISAGWLTRNEARELEDRNSLPGLDEPLIPMNSLGDKPGKPSDPNRDGPEGTEDPEDDDDRD